MDEWIYGWILGGTDTWDGWMDLWMDGLGLKLEFDYFVME